MAKEFSEKINSGELKKNVGGRPSAEIDQESFEKLCAMQCTRNEICAWFGITDKTLSRWCEKTYGEGFSAVYEKKRENGRISLRRAQFRLAEKSATMAIFLGKQILGQKDNVDLNVNKKEDIGVEIKSLSVHAIKALLKEGRKVVDVTDSVPDYLAELPTSELLQMLNTATKGEADGADKSQDKNQGEIETVPPDSVVKGADTEDD